MPFVVDASATLPWCFEDEATDWTEALLNRLAAGEQVIVPAHWLVEVSNGLLTAQRKRRINRSQAEAFLGRLASLNILIEPPLTFAQARKVIALSLKHNLTLYDAAYLDVAKRQNLPLATLDSALLNAAKTEKLDLLS